jgi:hypothetical protein
VAHPKVTFTGNIDLIRQQSVREERASKGLGVCTLCKLATRSLIHICAYFVEARAVSRGSRRLALSLRRLLPRRVHRELRRRQSGVNLRSLGVAIHFGCTVSLCCDSAVDTVAWHHVLVVVDPELSAAAPPVPLPAAPTCADPDVCTYPPPDLRIQVHLLAPPSLRRPQPLLHAPRASPKTVPTSVDSPRGPLRIEPHATGADLISRRPPRKTRHLAHSSFLTPPPPILLPPAPAPAPLPPACRARSPPEPWCCRRWARACVARA